MGTVKYYEAKLAPDARGFTTFLRVQVIDGEIIDAWIDGFQKKVNAYGRYKSASFRYNRDMQEESGTFYRDAARQLEREIVYNVRPLSRVKGAGVLSSDAVTLLAEIDEKIRLDKESDEVEPNE